MNCVFYEDIYIYVGCLLNIHLVVSKKCRIRGREMECLDTHPNFQDKCIPIFLNKALFQKDISFPLIIDFRVACKELVKRGKEMSS